MRLLRRRGVRIVLGLAILFGVALALLPVGLRLGLQRALLAGGAGTATVEDVDFNPFTGVLRLTGVRSTAPGGALLAVSRLQAQVDWWPLWRRRLHLRGLQVSGAELSVERSADAAWTLAGIAAAGGGAPAGAPLPRWAVGVDDLELAGVKVNVRTPRGEQEWYVERLSLRHLASWDSRRAIRLSLRGRIGGRLLALDASGTPFAAAPAVWGNLDTDGLDLGPLRDLAPAAAAVLEGRLDARLAFRAELRGGGPHLAADGRVALSDLRVRSEPGEVQAASAAWHGHAEISPGPAGSMPRVSVEGRLEGHDLRGRGVRDGAWVRCAEFSWGGWLLTGHLADGRNGVSQRAEIELRGLEGRAAGSGAGAALLHWDGTLRGFQAPGGGDPELHLRGSLAGAEIGLHADSGRITRAGLGIGWEGSLDAVPAGDGATAVALQGPASISRLYLQGSGLTLTQSPLHWDGLARATLGAGSRRAVVRGTLESAGLELAFPDRRVKLRHGALRWSGRLQAARAGNGHLSLDENGTLAVKRIDAGTPDARLEQQDLHWKGHARVERAADRAPLQARLDGSLTGGALSQRSSHPELDARQGGLAWRGRAEATLGAGGGVDLAQDGTLHVSAIHLVRPAMQMDQQNLEFTGRVQGTFPDGAGTVRLRYGSLVWSGRVGSGEDGVPQAQGRLTVHGIELDDRARSLRLLEASSLDLAGFSARGTRRVDVERARLDGLGVVRPIGRAEGKPVAGTKPGAAASPLLAAARTTVEAMQLRGNGALTVQSIEFRDLSALLRRDRKGRFRLIEDLLASLGRRGPAGAEGGAPGATGSVPPTATAGEAAPEPATRPGSAARPAATAAPAAGGEAPAVRIAEVRIAGDSLLRFDDESVTPPYRAALRFDRARIADLDSTRPGHASPLEISGRLGEYGTIELHGHIEPFAARLTLDMEGRIANLDIPPLSSYTARQLGYNLTSGQLDAEVKLRIVNGELQSENRLVLNNIDVKPEDPGRMQGLTHQLSVPLETALSLLRDEHNDIRLQLPVSGDITSPAFDMSDAVNQAVGNAMKTAAVGILKLALQPYGALATIAELAGEAASRVRLEPVTFGAGETSPAPAAGPYLDRIAGLMRERPGLRIRLCGWATPADRTRLAAETAAKTEMPAPEAEADTQSSGPLAAAAAASTTPVPPPEISDEDLQALARRRAETVKPRLVERHGIAAERLFVCHPEIDSGPGALPRVELLI